MAMGKRKKHRQQPLFVLTAELPQTVAHPIYAKLNEMLAGWKFDEFVEGLCAKFYEEMIGRPSLEPGRYFRLLLIGYFEGIDTPTREELVKIDKSRKNKASNDDWENPHDPDAKIAKMKDGRTHLAHKAERAVDMESGCVPAVTLQGADLGDTTTILPTITAATENLAAVADDVRVADKIDENIAKRLLVHVGGFNLSLVMRKLTGIGKPRRLQGLFGSIFASVYSIWTLWVAVESAWSDQRSSAWGNRHPVMSPLAA